MENFPPARLSVIMGDAMKIFKRVLKWFGIGLLFLFACLVLLLVLLPSIIRVLPYFLKPKVDAEIAAIKAKGEPITAAELAGPRIPDSENGAVVYQKIFEEMDGPRVKKDLEIAVRFSHAGKSFEPTREARLAISRLSHLIPMVEEAQSRPKCEFPIKWNDPPMSITFPHFAYLRRLSCLLCASAMLDAKDGKSDSALHLLDLAYVMSDSSRDGRTLISYYVRISLLTMSSRTLKYVAGRCDFNEEQARRLYDRLARMVLSGGSHDALVGERAMGISQYSLLREHPDVAIKQLSDHESPPDKGLEGLKHPSAVYVSMMYWDELFYLRTMREWIEVSRLPYREIKSRHLDSEPKFPPFAFMSAILLPVFAPTAKRDEGEAHIAGDQIMLALIAYKDRIGSYPTDLAQLRAKLGWKIPVDPFTGKDFIYKPTGKGFIFYSIGPNLKDDGGNPPRDKKSLEDEGDMIWQMDH